MEVLDQHSSHGVVVRFTPGEWVAVELFAEGLQNDDGGEDE